MCALGQQCSTGSSPTPQWQCSPKGVKGGQPTPFSWHSKCNLICQEMYPAYWYVGAFDPTWLSCALNYIVLCLNRFSFNEPLLNASSHSLKRPPRYYPLCKYISGFICHVEVQPMFLNKLPITVQSTLCKKLTQEFTHNAQGSPVATNTQGDKTSEINCFPWPVQEHPCVKGRQLWCNYTGWQLSPLPENVVYKHSAHSVR